MASILNVDNIRAVGSSTTGITVDSSGQVSLPKIPYAFVDVGTTTSVTPQADVPFDNVLSSQGVSWNTSTYQFTVPVSGLYQFSGAVRLNADRTYVYWVVADSSNNVLQTNKLILSQGYSGAGFTTATGSCHLSLSTGTNYKIRISDSTAASVNVQAGQSWMDVILLG